MKIDGDKLEKKHAQFLVLHLSRIARLSDTGSRERAQDLLDTLAATYPELEPESERNPFAGI